MIRAVTFTNYLGDSIRLDLARPEESGFIIKSVTGLGPGKANINTTEIATNDGSLFNSSRMPSRNIVISLAYMWKDSIEDVRQLSYKYFPIKKKLTMLIETDNRQAEIEGYVESNDPTIFSKDEGSDISIVCPNPFFYSAGKDGINTTIFYGVEALFEFPFSNESLKDPLLEMGEIKNETEQVVVYNGDAEIGVTITIHAIGEASNITIYNTGTREVMRIDTDKLEKFTGSGIIAGDEIIICTVKGNKSITLLRNGKTTNILNCLDKNADWFQLAKGDNIFAYTAEYGSTNLQFKIENRMIINVGVGRAWFNHTWTLNDALLPLVVPQSEILLNRYDAVVLEVDSREAVRANDIKIIKGTPASNPTKPTMVKTNDRWQYPLAYIYVGAGVTSIRQANITNCVGTSECPFVTAPLDKVEIDDLIAQWQDQWKEFYEKQTTDMEETNKFWKEQWSTWFLAQTEEIQSAYLTWEAQWNLWYSEHTADMEATSTYWKEKWEAWFNEYTSINTAEMADWKQKSETEFREWFDQLQALLDGNTAASLAKKLLELQEQVDILNQFSSNLENEYTVYQKLYDNGYRTYGDVLDSSDAPITDSNLDTVIGRTYSSDLLRDSNGDVIEGRAIFVIK